MNYLEKLLQGAPVEWKTLGEVCEDKFWIMPATPKFIEEGVPYITGKNLKNGKVSMKNIKYISYDDFKEMTKNRKIKKGDILISMIGTIGEIAIVDNPEFYGQNIYLLRLDKKIILNDFFLHFFNQDKVKHSLISKKNTSNQGYLKANQIGDLKIPIPPLAVQKEIAQILDRFTAITSELTSELTLRQKQYQHYRDQLLTFGDEVEWKTLGEVCDVRDGTHDSPAKQDFGKYLITSKNIKDGSVTFENAYYISETEFQAINRRSKVDIDDLLFTMIGTIGEIAHVTEEPDYAIKNVGLIKTADRNLARYLFHYLQSSTAKKYIFENKSKGSQAFLALGKIRSFPIPLPPIEEQKRIAGILDKFHTLAHSLSEGLPKEIALRQKQYEYYRDLLLGFDNLK